MLYYDPNFNMNIDKWMTAKIPYVRYSLNTEFSLFTQGVVCDGAECLDKGAIRPKDDENASGYDLDDLVARAKSDVLQNKAQVFDESEDQRERDSGKRKIDKETLENINDAESHIKNKKFSNNNARGLESKGASFDYTGVEPEYEIKIK